MTTKEKTLAERLTELILDRDSGGDRQLAFFVRFNQPTILAALSDAERLAAADGIAAQLFTSGPLRDAATAMAYAIRGDQEAARKCADAAKLGVCEAVLCDPQAELSRLRADAERMREENERMRFRASAMREGLATVRCRLRLTKAYDLRMRNDGIDDLCKLITAALAGDQQGGG